MRSRSTLSIARSKGLRESEGNDLALNPPPRRGGGRLWWVGVHFTPDDGAGLLAMCAQKKSAPEWGAFQNLGKTRTTPKPLRFPVLRHFAHSSS